ncbi:MAG: hypothetical protein GXO94_02300 [Nitrospirae bacterium]|nr:hypothetical protein [Nitrospirota bacterium]
MDFNVHPAKREVRFSDKEAVYRSVYSAVREALRGPAEEASDCVLDSGEAPAGIRPGETWLQAVPPDAQPSTSGVPFVSDPLIRYSGDLRFIYLGDVFVAYTEGRGVTLLDHHAAHERILYERLRRGTDLEVTQMLFPRQVRLAAREYRVLIQHLEALGEMGIEAEDFGHDTLMVRAVPGFMFDADIAGILSDVAFCLIEATAGSPVEELKDRIAKRIACHGSVRGAVMLSHAELSRLLDDLEAAEDPEHCPHGRPTRIRMSIDDLKRMFRRTG